MCAGVLKLSSNGKFVRDRMHKRWRKRIDFLVPESIKGGKWENVILTHKKSFYK